jgi:hypothetical protein
MEIAGVIEKLSNNLLYGERQWKNKKKDYSISVYCA